MQSTPIIDTHTHFDDAVFDSDRLSLAEQAKTQGVTHLVLVGYLKRYFERMIKVKAQLESIDNAPVPHLALGLHPAYIDAHGEDDLDTLERFIISHAPIAIGEIGLDTYTNALKQSDSIITQTKFFNAQLDMAVAHQLPVMLHIRKAHAESLKVLKAHDYDAHQLGGIAHSFSGGEQEAKAFVKLGFKLGVTGQITNPNAKKLRRAITAAVQEYGLSCLVIETDCPDMTPLPFEVHDNKDYDNKDYANKDPDNKEHNTHDDNANYGHQHNRNVPANLTYVINTLSHLFDTPIDTLAKQLWQNSCEALRVDWDYQ